MAVVELEECLRVAKVVGLRVMHQFCSHLKLSVGDGKWFSHILKAVGAFCIRTSQDHNMVFARLNRELEVCTAVGLGVSDFKSCQIEPQGLSHRIG